MSTARLPNFVEQSPRFWHGKVKQRLTVAISIGVIIVLAGTLGYWLLEDWSLMDSFYMTIITLTTVGFGEIHPLDTSGRILTTIIIIVGVFLVGYSATVVASSLLEAEFTGRARERRMRQQLEKMRDHVIICGFGRVGRIIANEFLAEGVPFIVIDSREDQVEECQSLSIPTVLGDAAQDEVLRVAGIDRALSLVSAVDDDSQNVFITLSARVMNPNIRIVARAAEPTTERKLELAGADHVVSPYTIAGHRMAGVVLRPKVIEFTDRVIYSGGISFWIEDILVGAGSELDDHTLTQVGIRGRTGALVLAIVHADGTRVTNPSPDVAMVAGDSIIAIGTRDQLRMLEEIARPDQVESR